MLFQTVDNDLALKIYLKAGTTPEVVKSFAERKEFGKIPIYSRQVNNKIELWHALWYSYIAYKIIPKSLKFVLSPLIGPN